MAYGSGYPGGYSDIIDTCAIPKGLFLDGSAGTYVSTPDSALLSLQGTESVLALSGFQNTYASIPGNTSDIAVGADLDLRWEGFIDSFITGGASDQQYMISNYNHNVAGFKLFVGTNATTLRFQASISGSNSSATAAHSLAPNTRVRIRVVRVFTTGSTTLFAGPATTDWLSLPSLAAPAIVFANTIIPNSATTMKIGSGEGIAAFSGRTSNASMIVGSTTVFNPDFSTTPWIIGDVSAQARLDGAGKTWTLNGNAEVVALAERRSLRLSGSSGSYTSTPDSAAVSLQGSAQGLAFSGNSADTITAPDSVGLSVTGDFDVQFRLQPDVWNVPTQINLGGKYGAAGQRSWRVQISNLGRPSLEISSDGTAVTFIGANATPSFTAGQAGWIRATWRASDGRVQFFTAPDAATPVWTQLGTDQTAAIGSIFDSTTSVQIIGNANLFPSTTRLLAFRYFAGLIETDTRANLQLVASPWAIGEQSGVSHSDGINTWTLGGGAEIVALAERRSLRLSGATNTYASTPDSVALSITGDIDLRAQVAMDDWTPAATQRIVTKETPTTQRSYGMGISSAGNILLRWSTDGTTAQEFGSTVATGFADGSVNWVRATRVAATGILQFFTSPDGVTYTQLGTNVNPGTTGNLFDSTAPLEIGVRSATNEPFTGNILKVEVMNGIAGTIVADPNFTARPWDVGESNGTTGADAAGNTWTLTGTGAIIQKSFSSDLDVRAYIAPDTWTGAAGTSGSGLLAKWTDSSFQFSFIFRLTSGAKTLNLLWSSNASTTLFPNASSTTTVPFADGSGGWVRATLDVDNGSNQRVIIFYTSTDGQNWTQLGTTVTQAGATTILDSTTPLTFGVGNLAQPGLWGGNVYYAEMRNGIDGVVVAGPDFRKRPWVVGETSTANHGDRVGNTWTLNAAGSIIQRAYASDLDLRVKVNLPDLDNGGVKQGFLSTKQGTNFGYGLGMNAAGALELAWGNGGISFFKAAGVGGFMIDGNTKWLRATLDVDDGAGNNVIRMYWSDNGAASWTLFSTITTPGPTLIADSPNSLLMGANGVSFQTMLGTLYYAEIRNGIDGTQVVVFNPSAPPWQVGDAAPTTRPDQFGNNFTLFGTAKIIGPTGNCDFTINICGGGYAGGQYATAVYAGGVPCSGQDYPLPIIESNVEDFCILSADCN